MNATVIPLTQHKRGGEFDQMNYRANESFRPRVLQRTPIAQAVSKSSATVTGTVQNFSVADQSFVDFLRGRGSESISTYQALRYYAEGSVIFDAVDEISSKGSPITPVLWDRVSEEFIKSHPLLDLLARPNADMRGKQLRTGWLVYWLVTGNVPMISSGLPGSEPSELWVYAPYCLNLVKSGTGQLGRVQLNMQNETVMFQRDEQDRYVGGPGGIYQLQLSREFNPFSAKQGMWGMSKLNPLFYEIEQLMSINVHNNSLLKRGATPSMLFSAQGNLSDEQFERLKQQVELYYSGAANAGRPMLGENGMDAKPLTTSNKDMDYKSLTESLATRVYNVFNVPLPQVSTASQTYSNYETSRLRLYDEAILPVVQEMFDELGTFLIPMYRDLEGGGGISRYMITYDDNDIPALETRRIENLVRVNKTGVISVNEQRMDYLAKDEVAGGDEILVQGSLRPIGAINDLEDDVVDDVATKPEPAAVDAGIDPGEQVQEQALNGAQISSLQEIVQAVADGLLPAASAIGLIMIAFPGMSRDQASEIIEPAAEFAGNKPPAPTAPVPPVPPTVQAPPEGETEEEQEKRMSARVATLYAEVLRKYTKSDGTALYSEEEVEQIVAKHTKKESGNGE